MGLLQEGKWVDQWYDTESTGGRFKRKAPQFRHWVTADGSAGPSGDAGLRQLQIVITYMCHLPVRGLIER